MGKRCFLLQQIQIVRGYRRHDCLLIVRVSRVAFGRNATSPVIANLIVAA
jgi:hypothetical protein